MQLPEININLTAGIPLVLIVLMIIIAGTWLYYKRTLPDISPFRKIILSLLRGTSLFLIFLILFELIIGFSFTKKEAARTVFLVDKSKSITAGLDSSSKSLFQDLLKKIDKTVQDNPACNLISFSDKIQDTVSENISNMKFDGFATDINAALEYISNSNQNNSIQSIVLLSDGIFNNGEKPTYLAEKLNLPVYTIGTGNPEVRKDIVVMNLLTNEVCYKGNKTQLKVEVNNFGFQGSKATVNLLLNNKPIDKKEIVLNEGINEILFDYIPEQSGKLKLSASVTQFDSELSLKNNYSEKYIDVIDNKINILVVASNPSSDFSFVISALRQNKDYNVNGLIDKGSNGFYPQYNRKELLDSADIFFLIGYPSKNSSAELMNAVLDRLQTKNRALFITVSNYTDFEKLSAFRNFLPFETGRIFGDFSQIFIDISSSADNEILNLGDPASAEIWNSFPPVYRVDREFSPKPGSEVLASIKMQNNKINIPSLIRRNLNKQKTISLLVFEIWRLKLLNSAKSDQGQYFNLFINNCVKWLSTSEIKKQLIIEPAKKIFDNSEKVSVLGQLYDESNNPVSNADIVLKIKESNGNEFSSRMNSVGNGMYSLSPEGLTKGDYSYSAETFLNNKKYEDRGKFSISETELEYKDLTMREGLLKQLAAITGGRYYNLKESNDFVSNLNSIIKQNYIEKRTTTEEALWNSAYLLILIIILLSAEWFLRKRYGLL